MWSHSLFPLPRLVSEVKCQPSISTIWWWTIFFCTLEQYLNQLWATGAENQCWRWFVLNLTSEIWLFEWPGSDLSLIQCWRMNCFVFLWMILSSKRSKHSNKYFNLSSKFFNKSNIMLIASKAYLFLWEDGMWAILRGFLSKYWALDKIIDTIW